MLYYWMFTWLFRSLSFI